jgi:hypothetical protein
MNEIIPDVRDSSREAVRQVGCFLNGRQGQQVLHGPPEQSHSFDFLLQRVTLELSFEDPVLQVPVLCLQAL